MRAALPSDLVEIEAEPGFDDGVDIGNAELAAQFHQVQRGSVDGKIDAESGAFSIGQKRRQEVAVIRLRHSLPYVPDAMPSQQCGILVPRVDDHHATDVEIEVAFDEGKRAATDRAEADHHHRTGDPGIDGGVGVGHQFVLSLID